jgi:hypothetical protein
MSFVNHIVDTLHVGRTDIEVVRAIRRCFHKEAFMRMHRRMRHRVYREAIKRHRRNKALFMAVALGDFQQRRAR